MTELPPSPGMRATCKAEAKYPELWDGLVGQPFPIAETKAAFRGHLIDGPVRIEDADGRGEFVNESIRVDDPQGFSLNEN